MSKFRELQRKFIEEHVTRIAPFVEELKSNMNTGIDEIVDMALEEHKHKCPFIYVFLSNNIKKSCPYQEENQNCSDIDICPGNSDALCTAMIEDCVHMNNLHYC